MSEEMLRLRGNRALAIRNVDAGRATRASSRATDTQQSLCTTAKAGDEVVAPAPRRHASRHRAGIEQNGGSTATYATMPRQSEVVVAIASCGAARGYSGENYERCGAVSTVLRWIRMPGCHAGTGSDHARDHDGRDTAARDGDSSSAPAAVRLASRSTGSHCNYKIELATTAEKGISGDLMAFSRSSRDDARCRRKSNSGRRLGTSCARRP